MRHAPCRHTASPCRRAAVPPCRRAAVPPCRHTAIPPYRIAVPPCRRAAVPPCRRAAVPPCRRAAVPPCRRAAVPPCAFCFCSAWGTRVQNWPPLFGVPLVHANYFTAQTTAPHKQRRHTNNGATQTTAPHKQRRHTNNGATQTTAPHKQRRHTNNAATQTTPLNSHAISTRIISPNNSASVQHARCASSTAHAAQKRGAFHTLQELAMASNAIHPTLLPELQYRF